MQRDDGIPGAFRAHFARHNRQALALAALSFAGALLCWVIVYMVVYWLVLFAVTIGEGIDAHMPPFFTRTFAICVAGLCVLGWIIQKISPNYFQRDKKPAFEVFLDLILAAPRMTLAVWGNLSAWQSLNETEMEAAWELFLTIAERGKLSIHSLPIEVPDARLRSRIVFALQMTGLVQLRKDDENAWLALQGDTARKLGRATVKIETGRGR